MDRRLFLTGLAGAAGTAALAMALPRQAAALPTGPLQDLEPENTGSLLDELNGTEETVSPDGIDTAWHRGYRHRHHRRRRRRRRRWSRVCRRYRNRWGHWVRRCWREPRYFWIWI